MRPGTGSSSREATAYARAARRIVDMAQRGTRDQKELANGAVRFLAANYRLEHKRTTVAPETLPVITGADIGESLPAP
jgi:hypothetical protein